MEINETALNFTISEIFPTAWNLSDYDCDENETYSYEDEPDMIGISPRLTIIPRMFHTETNDSVLDAGVMGWARSFSLPMPSGPEEDYDFNHTIPSVLYSSMPVTTWVFSHAVDDSDDYEYEEGDYESEDFVPENLLTLASADLEAPVQLDADETLEETVTTEKPIHKTTRKRKIIKKKQKKKRKTTKRRRKTTKKST